MNKVDLHLHLDGSLDLKTSYDLAIKRNIVQCDFEEFKSLMEVSDDNPSLEEYLKCFDLPIRILQDKEALIESTYALIRNLYNDHLIYAEIRFAPQFHTHKGLTQDEVIQYVLQGREKACKEFDIKINFILCMMTLGEEKINHSENLMTIDMAKKYLNKGVCAIDIAGPEEISPLIKYKPLFDYASSLNIPYTIHAGESGSSDNVLTALNLGARRIGHGCHCSSDQKVVDRIITDKIPLEVCLTSNIHCKNQVSFQLHTCKPLFDQGVLITLNTDNMTLSRTTIKKEYDLALEYLFTEDELKQIEINSINAAFISEKEKQELLSKI